MLRPYIAGMLTTVALPLAFMCLLGVMAWVENWDSKPFFGIGDRKHVAYLCLVELVIIITIVKLLD